MTGMHGCRDYLKKYLIASLLVIVLLVVSLNASSVSAQSGLVLSTPFPGISIKTGQSVTFPLNIRNTGVTPQVVNLKVVSAPEGWKTALEGKGNIIHQVFVDSRSSEEVDLKIEIPDQTPEGNYNITVKASSSIGSDTLNISLKVKEEAEGGSKLVTQYSELEGTGNASFTFRVDLVNDRSKAQSYSLGAKAPRGWEVTFSPSYSSKHIASITVEPESTQGLDVEIKPPRVVKAGEYTIPITAVSANETLSTELKVIIKGTYDMNLTTSTGLLSVETTAGKKKEVTLVVENTGSLNLRGVTFSTWEPRDWSVDFEPKELDVIEPGQSKEVKAYIQPDSKAIAGDYVVRITASTPEVNRDVEFRVTVKISTLWGFVGIAIIAALGYGVYWVFKEYGRR